jgi:peptidoglycan/LPS O-acetylase OafA/YrhL
MRDVRVLRAVRLGAVAAGSLSLLLAMTVWADAPGPRDLAWTIGVALLVLSLVANRLLRKAEAAAPDNSGSDKNAD